MHAAIGPRSLLPLFGLAALACATPLPPEFDMSYAQALARADADDARAPAYKSEVRAKVRPKLFRGALECGMMGQREDVGLVLGVAADGSVAATYVEPSNARTRCFARRAESATLPPPPHAPFFVGARSNGDDDEGD